MTKTEIKIQLKKKQIRKTN